MSDRLRSWLRLLVTAGMAGLLTVLVVTAGSPTEDRAERIGEQIRCPVCEGEPIADSPSGLARDMMALVRQRVEEGRSDEQIVEELLASYTGAQLLDPPLTWSTVALWAVPLLVLAGGVLAIRGRLRQPPGDDARRPRVPMEQQR